MKTQQPYLDLVAEVVHAKTPCADPKQSAQRVVAGKNVPTQQLRHRPEGLGLKPARNLDKIICW